MADLRLALRMTADGSELAKEANRSRDAVVGLQEAANDAAVSLREMEQGAVVSLAAQRRLAEETGNAEAAALRSASAFGAAVQALDALKQAYDPVYAGQRRYADEVQKAERILATANATDEERARILMAVAAAYDPVIRRAREAAAAEQKAALDAMAAFGQARNALEQMKRSYDPVYDAQRRYTDELQKAERILAAANASDEDRAAILRAVAEAYDPAIAAQRDAAAQAAKEAASVRALIDQLSPADVATRRLAEAQQLLDRARAGEIEGVTLSENRYRALSRALQGAGADYAGSGRAANENAAAHENAGHAAHMAAMGMATVKSNAFNAAQVLVATRGDVLSMAGPLGDVAQGFAMMGGRALVAAGIVSAIAAPFVAAGYAVLSYTGSLHELERVNILTGGAVGLTTDQLVRQGDMIASTAKLSRSNARELEGTYLSTGRIAGDVLVKLAQQTRDYAAATDQDLDKAREELAGLFSDPARGAEELTQRWGVFSQAQRTLIRNYQDQGQLERAQLSLLDGLQPRIQGAAERMGFFARNLDWVKRTTSDILDRMGRVGATPTLGETQDRRRQDIANAPNPDDALIPELERQRQDAARVPYYADTHDEREQAIQAHAAATTQALQKQRDVYLQLSEAVSPSTAAMRQLENVEIALQLAVDKGVVSRRAAAQVLAQYRDQLQQAISPAAAFADALERQSRVTLARPGVQRTVEEERQRELKERGLKPGDALPQRVEDRIYDAAFANGQANAKANHDAVQEQIRDTRELAGATASLSPAALAHAQAKAEERRVLRETNGDVNAAAQAYRDKLAVAMAEVSGQAGAQATQTSISARQMLALAAAYEKGGAAVAEVEAANRVELETLRAGAGAHSALATAILEEEKAKRRLMAAQYDRDMVMQTEAAKALALAERDGAKAVASAQAANAAAVQIEREGVAADSDRAKAIREKIDALAKWQEQQAYNRESRQADNELKLAQLELSLVHEAEPVRTRLLELARYELEIREKFPQKSEEEIQALLRKRDVLIETQQQIQRQRAAWEEIGQTLERAFERVGDALVQAFVEGKKGAIDWGSLTRGIIASIVSDLVKMALIRPFQNMVFGSNQPTLWDTFSGGGAAQNGGWSGVANQVGRAGSNLLSNQGSSWVADQFGFSGGMTGVYNGAAEWLGMSGTNAAAESALWSSWGAGGDAAMAAYGGGEATAAMAASEGMYGAAAGAAQGAGGGLTAGGSSLAAGLGTASTVVGGALAAYGIGGAIGTATNSKAAGAAGGAAVGAMYGTMILPGWGTAIGAVIGAILGAVGTQKKATPYGAAWDWVNESGTVTSHEQGAENGPNADDISKGVAAVRQTIGVLATTAGGKFPADLKGIGTEVHDGDVRTVIGSGGWDKGTVVSTEEDFGKIAFDTFKYLVEHDQITVANDDVRKAIAATPDKDVQKLAENIAFAKDFRAQVDMMNGSLSPVDNALKQMNESAKAAGENVKTYITDWRDKAVELGLASKEELNPALQKSLDAMMGLTDAASPLIGVNAVVKQAQLEFEQYRQALAEVGRTTDEITQRQNQYVQNAVDAYNRLIAAGSLGGRIAVEQTINPAYRINATDRMTLAGLNADKFPSFTKNLQHFLDVAAAGSATAADLRDMADRAYTHLSNGRITVEQYNSIIQTVTQAYTASSAALRQEADAIRQAQGEIVSAWGRIRDAATAAINDLRMDPKLSTLSDQERVDYGFGLVKDAYDRVMTGRDKDGKLLTDAQRQAAADDFQANWRPYLEQARAYYADQPEYMRRESQLLSWQGDIRDRAGEQISVAQRQLDALESIDARLAANDNSIQNPGRVWAAAGFEANIPTNIALARPVVSNGVTYRYDGNFGGGDWTTFVRALPEEVKEVYRQRLRADGHPERINFATGAAFYGQGVYERPVEMPIMRFAEAGPEGILPLANVGGRMGVHAVIDAPAFDAAPVVAAIGGTTGAVMEIGTMIARSVDRLSLQVANLADAVDRQGRELGTLNTWMRKRAA